MAFIALGALIGTIGIGGGAYIFGATLAASMLAGAAIGSLFESAQLGASYSPTYSFGPLSNSKTQVLPIPVIYGKCRVAGNIFYELYLDDDKTRVERMIGVSEGPIESISDVLADDQDPSELSGCSVDTYLNTTPETSDSRDPEGDRPYPDDLAFIAVTLKAQEKLSGPATITSIVEGRKVWTPEGVQYTRNPAWIIRDFLTNERYGLGIPESSIDEAWFVASANYCDELVEWQPRFTLDFAVDTYKHGPDILAEMLSCFRGFIIKRDKIQLRIDAPVTTYDKEIGMNNIVDGSFTWWQSSDEDALNRVIIEWIDPDNHWERTTTVFEDAADIAVRGVVEKTFSLLGITRPEQVARMGAYLIDSSQGVRNFCSFNLSLKDADIEVGDVIALTHELPGWTDKWMRVLTLTDTGDTEDITVVCSEYVAEVYNDRALDIPTHVDTGFPNPYECPDVESLVAIEQIQVLADGTILSNIDITWTDPAAFLSGIEVAILEQDSYEYRVLAVVPPGTEGYVARNISPDQSVSIKVTAINNMGIRAIGASTGLILYGKANPPGVPINLSAAGGFRQVTIRWTNAADPDLFQVEVRESETDDFEDSHFIGAVSGNTYIQSGLENLKPYWYWARSVDTSGNTSSWVGPVGAVTGAIEIDGEGSIVVSQDGFFQVGNKVYIDVTRATFLVDTFQLVDADDEEVAVPFELREDGKIYIKYGMIEDLTIGRIKIATGETVALTWGESSEYSEGQLFDEDIDEEDAELLYGGKITIPSENVAQVLVMATVMMFVDGGIAAVDLYKNDVQVRHVGTAVSLGGTPANTTFNIYWMDTDPSEEETDYELRLYCDVAGGGYVLAQLTRMAVVTFFR